MVIRQNPFTFFSGLFSKSIFSTIWRRIYMVIRPGEYTGILLFAGRIYIMVITYSPGGIYWNLAILASNAT